MGECTLEKGSCSFPIFADGYNEFPICGGVHVFPPGILGIKLN